MCRPPERRRARARRPLPLRAPPPRIPGLACPGAQRAIARPSLAATCLELLRQRIRQAGAHSGVRPSLQSVEQRGARRLPCRDPMRAEPAPKPAPKSVLTWRLSAAPKRSSRSRRRSFLSPNRRNSTPCPPRSAPIARCRYGPSKRPTSRRAAWGSRFRSRHLFPLWRARRESVSKSTPAWTTTPPAGVFAFLITPHRIALAVEAAAPATQNPPPSEIFEARPPFAAPTRLPSGPETWFPLLAAASRSHAVG